MPSPESRGFVPEEKNTSDDRGSFEARWAARNFATDRLGKRIHELATIAIRNDERRDSAREEIAKLKLLQAGLEGDEQSSEVSAETFIRGEIKRLNDKTGGEPTGADGEQVEEFIKQYSAFHKNLTEN